ncbi:MULTISPECIES: RidA family protein [Latilactobacillus]|jgi:2-iminobutanoate/2-iminopropanoate deaminase|uniref:Reactive intermediate/imine deaminase n=1 Tax=Latilactobacillus curvatus TaxID=28038 RepID=A0A0B2XGN3_LATCU|nr:Rid family detoxifying hydrolase [Latilactobacillus curvatus]MDT3393158.1 Rid family detoxifying hydrolase [Bacillota bacterium]ANJ68901.1 reactive intermediate/imine deaminase [Latilactobacillus curvatus]AOO75945.1 reactive intermediate/imine deaminase [Latilactobacillus curvatus]ASN60600.1 reactive intermediate/imine deaminase [Latilactobacillus curvatus]ASN62553.1 reactive intermediate/imine deaminase [Latilactobacillus curvatus]
MTEKIYTNLAPEPLGPYSQAIATDQLVFMSGQLGLKDGQLAPDLASQTKQAITNMQHVLAAAGLSLENVVKTNCFLTDLDDFNEFNEVYARFFGDIAPARSAVQVGKLPAGAIVEIEAVAIR